MTVVIPKKVWSVGSLTCTSAGLFALFCWLPASDFAWLMKERGLINLTPQRRGCCLLDLQRLHRRPAKSSTGLAINIIMYFMRAV